MLHVYFAHDRAVRVCGRGMYSVVVHRATEAPRDNTWCGYQMPRMPQLGLCCALLKLPSLKVLVSGGIRW